MDTSQKEQNFEEYQRQFCSFVLAENLFGIDIQDVKEIKDDFSFTPIHHAPKEIKGFVNIRGQVHLIIDLRLLLNFQNKEVDTLSRIILFKQDVAGEHFGALVDSHSGVIEVSNKLIEYHKNDTEHLSTEEYNNRKKLTIGVCKLDSDLMTILDARKMLTTIKL